MKIEVVRWCRHGDAGENAARSCLEAEGYQVMSWRDAAGTVYEPHHHDHDESLCIVEGTMTFGIGDREYALGAGDRLMLPAGTVHSAVAGERGAAYLVGEKRS